MTKQSLYSSLNGFIEFGMSVAFEWKNAGKKCSLLREVNLITRSLNNQATQHAKLDWCYARSKQPDLLHSAMLVAMPKWISPLQRVHELWCRRNLQGLLLLSGTFTACKPVFSSKCPAFRNFVIKAHSSSLYLLFVPKVPYVLCMVPDQGRK
jgi:hypothetical protein